MQYHFFDGEKSCFGFQLDYRGDKDRGEKVPKVADWDFDEDDLGLHCGVRHLLARPFFKVLRRCCRRQLLPKSLSAMASTSSAAKTTFDIGKVKQEVVEQEQAQDGTSPMAKEADSGLDISGMIKTELTELTTGDEIVEEANRLFSKKGDLSSPSNGPKVSMAFKITKKKKKKKDKNKKKDPDQTSVNDGQDATKKKKKKKKEKKVKVILTSRKTMEAMMAAAQKGEDMAKLMEKYLAQNDATYNEGNGKRKKSDKVPLSLTPTKSVIDEMRDSIIDNDTFGHEFDELDNFEESEAFDDMDDIFDDGGYSAQRIDYFDQDPEFRSTRRGRGRGKAKGKDKEEKIKVDPDFDPNIFDENDDGEQASDGRRGRKRKAVVSLDKRFDMKVANTLPKDTRLNSMDMDTYLVSVKPKSDLLATDEEDEEEGVQRTEETANTDRKENDEPPMTTLKKEESNNEAETDLTKDDFEVKREGELALENLIKIYGCVFCPWTGTRVQWRQHLVKEHKDKNIKVCIHKRCHMAFESQELLDKHNELERSRPRGWCDLCKKDFKSASKLREHTKVHLDSYSSEYMKYACQYCGRQFCSRTGLKWHIARIHTRDLPHKCDWEGCDKAFFSRPELVSHKRVHTGERPFVCTHCGKAFATKKRVVEHEKAKHFNFEVKMIDGKKTLVPLQREKIFSCSFCGKSFANKKTMQMHENIHTGAMPFSCKYCDRSFRCVSSRHHHMIICKEKPPEVDRDRVKPCCSLCGKQFPTRGCLKRHEKIHLNDKKYACAYCGKAFVQKCNMDAHERIHTGDKPYKCKFCGDGFVQGTRRNQHQKTCKERPRDLTQEPQAQPQHPQQHPQQPQPHQQPLSALQIQPSQVVVPPHPNPTPQAILTHQHAQPQSQSQPLSQPQPQPHPLSVIYM